MNQASHRLARATVSTVSAVALGVGLAVPVAAAPGPAIPGTDTTGLSRVLSDPANLTEELKERRLPTGAVLQAEASSAVEITATEIARTETSATYRFTLPEGQVTREGAVVQGYGDAMGMRLSALTFVTNPAAGFGADHSAPYEQQLLDIQIAELISETFSINGATVHSAPMRPGLVVPAGQTSVDITVASSRTLAELVDAVVDITGEPMDEHQLLAWEQIFEGRLEMIPETSSEEGITWRYGDPVWAIDRVGSAMQSFPNGGNELDMRVSGTALEITNVITRVDGAPFSGNRVVATQDRLLAESLFGGKSLHELLSIVYPEPLRFSNPSTTVSGATPVRNGFYRPDVGAETVTVTTTHTGPGSAAEARTAFETWATETCEVSMEDPIPGYRVDEASEPMTWTQYIDEVADTFGQQPEDEEPPEQAIYTGEEYIDAALNAQSSMFDMAPLLLLLFGMSPDDLDVDSFDFDMVTLFEQLKPVDWDEACGTTAGDPDPGDQQPPANLSITAPDSGTVGVPMELSATVTDANDNPVPGVEVTFSVTESGTPTLAAATGAVRLFAGSGSTILTATTDSNGVARVQFTPSKTGSLSVKATTGGDVPIESDLDVPLSVTDSDSDSDSDDASSGSIGSGSLGSLGSLFGSLASS